MELIVEEVDTTKLRVDSNASTPHRVLPLSDHLQTIVEKSSDVEPTDLEVPTTDQSRHSSELALTVTGERYPGRNLLQKKTPGGNLDSQRNS